jgi:holo-[acyl-carrier protein] synthase
MMPDLPEGTNVLGVGTDLIEVERVRSSLEQHGDRFLEKVFTPVEREYCQGMADPAPHLAARFAAKEAIAKAFRTGIGAELGWRDAGIENGPAGDPVVLLSDKGSALLAERGGREILVSLSHVSAMAIAMAVITK